MSKPLVSVIIPCYNAERFIREAVDSILAQTWSELEVIVVDDGSGDRSAAILKTISDPRLKIITQKNAGMAAALNTGIEQAEGDFIARQDADDISLPERITAQMEVLLSNNDLVLCGTHAVIVDGDGVPTGRVHDHPATDEALKFFLIFDNPFVHSSVIFRRRAFTTAGGYDTTEHPLLQDFELWYKMAVAGEITNIPVVLQKYRELKTGISATTAGFSKVVADKMLEHVQNRLSGIAEHKLRQFSYIFHGVYDHIQRPPSRRELLYIFSLLVPINNSNQELNKLVDEFRLRLQTHFYNYKILYAGLGRVGRSWYKLRKRLLYSGL